MRVLGWYHSHPHITVWPSHVGKYCSPTRGSLWTKIRVFCGYTFQHSLSQKGVLVSFGHPNSQKSSLRTPTYLGVISENVNFKQKFWVFLPKKAPSIYNMVPKSDVSSLSHPASLPNIEIMEKHLSQSTFPTVSFFLVFISYTCIYS